VTQPYVVPSTPEFIEVRDVDATIRKLFKWESWLNFHHGGKLEKRFQLSAYENDESTLKNDRYHRNNDESIISKVDANIH
jgi:hypothetical protein